MPAFADFIAIFIAQFLQAEAALPSDSKASPNRTDVPKMTLGKLVHLVRVLKVPISDTLASLAQVVDGAFGAYDVGEQPFSRQSGGSTVRLEAHRIDNQFVEFAALWERSAKML